MPPRPAPADQELSSLLSNLLGREAQVKKAPAAPLDANASLVLGLYRSDDQALGAVCAADTKLAAGAGAALALVPARVVEEAAKTGKLPPELLENFREILNVACALLNKPGHSHLVFHDTLTPPLAPPEDVSALLASPPQRADYVVEIAGYGGGTLTILTA
jgi:hypothetical protein